MASKATDLEKKPDGTINFSIIIPKDEVEKSYQRALSIATQQTELKGFRKGKAPASLVEEKIGKQKLYTQSLEHVLPKHYSESIKSLKLKPISSPKIVPEKLQEGKDWQLKVTIAEKPKIALGDYKKNVSGSREASKIWVPGKDTTSPQTDPTQNSKDTKKQNQQTTDERLSRIFDALLKNIKFNLPQFLLEEQINRELSQLLQQIQRLGLTLEQYLVSLGKTSDQLRKEYRDQAERTLRLEFILNEIALDLKVSVSKNEVDELIKAVGDDKLRQKLDTPSERLSINTSLRKRKVIDQLLKM